MKFNKQSGQALIGTAIAMVVLAGFAGLAIDMGTPRYQKRFSKRQRTAEPSLARRTLNLHRESRQERRTRRARTVSRTITAALDA